MGDFVGNGQKWLCPNPTCMDINAEEVSDTLDKMLSPTIKPIISKKLDLSKVNVRVCDPSNKKC